MIQVKEQLEQCLDKFRAGTLDRGGFAAGIRKH